MKQKFDYHLINEDYSNVVFRIDDLTFKVTAIHKLSQGTESPYLVLMTDDDMCTWCDEAGISSTDSGHLEFVTNNLKEINWDSLPINTVVRLPDDSLGLLSHVRNDNQLQLTQSGIYVASQFGKLVTENNLFSSIQCMGLYMPKVPGVLFDVILRDGSCLTQQPAESISEASWRNDSTSIDASFHVMAYRISGIEAGYSPFFRGAVF